MIKNRILRYSLAAALLGVLTSVQVGFAQETKPIINASLTGQVIDAITKEPIGGVTVRLDAVTHSVQTDRAGQFAFVTGQKLPVTLIVSYLGYETKTVIAGASTIVIELNPFSEDLDEVIVVGYGTQKKRDLTGSVTSLEAADFNTGFQQSVDQLIAGRAPGVQVTQSSSEPGGGASIRIRGANSINASNEPLYVIDGLPINNAPISPTSSVVGDPSPRNPLNSLNPNDIKSVEILKDASATAIYGSRAANGVIL